MTKLGLKDSSRNLHVTCVTCFFPTFNTLCIYNVKIFVLEAKHGLGLDIIMCHANHCCTYVNLR